MKRCLRTTPSCALLLRLLSVIGCCLTVFTARADGSLNVGALPAAESRLLGELIAESARRAGTRARVKIIEGDARTLFAALRRGRIDVCAVDSGTLARAFPGLPAAALPSELERRLETLGLSADIGLGYSAGLGLAMTESRAATLSIHRVSELRTFFELRLGLPGRFQRTRGGWPSLRDSYELDGMPVVTVEGDAAFAALVQDRVDVILLQLTDPRISQLGLRVLQDDWAVFREYPMVLVYKKSLRTPPAAAWRGMLTLQNGLSVNSVRTLRMALEADPGSQAAEVRAWLDSRHTPSRPGNSLPQH